MENDNKFGYEKITVLVDNMPLTFVNTCLYVNKQFDRSSSSSSSVSLTPSVEEPYVSM